MSASFSFYHPELLSLLSDNLFHHLPDKLPSVLRSEGQFLVPDWGMKLALEWGCRTGPPAYAGWRAEAECKEKHGGWDPMPELTSV
jgi:hypothetical protein